MAFLTQFAVNTQGIGKIVWDGRNEPKGYLMAYIGTSRVLFVHRKRAKKEHHANGVHIFCYFSFRAILTSPNFIKLLPIAPDADLR